jgi:cardiolipin synthase
VNTRQRCLLLAVSISLLAGCASMKGLPKPPQPKPASERDQPLSIIGPDGRIDRRTRERVSKRLMAMGDDNLLAQHLAAMDMANSAPLISGNSVQLLIDGPRTYAAMFSAIAAARETVNIEMFIFGEAQHDGRNLSDLLVEVARKGVAVNVLYDSLGSADTPPAVFDKLRAAGIRLCEFNPVNPASNRTWQYVQRDHRKIVVVDARTAFAGGINFSSAYSSGSRATLSHHRKAEEAIAEGWRDTQVQVDGPVTIELQRLFLESWDKQKCPARQDANYLPEAVSAGSTLLRLDATSTDSVRNETYISALSVLTFARKTIDLTMAYFAPDDQVDEALVNAAHRGVRVRLLLAGLTDFDGIMHAGRAHYTQLLKAGVQIFESQKVLLHAKTVEVDGVWSTVGSANWDWRSFAVNDELNVVIIDAGFAQQMQAQYELDLTTASPIILSEWKHRPVRERMLQRFWAMWERML